MDERMASTARNNRERRQIRAQEKIAENLGLIADTLLLWYTRTYPDSELPDVITPDENAEQMERFQSMLGGLKEE